MNKGIVHRNNKEHIYLGIQTQQGKDQRLSYHGNKLEK
jgi:hypothetical protein